MKEPNLIKKEINLNNQKKVLVISILALVILLLSSSYAILTNFTKTDDVITFQTGNLEMSILNGEETFSLINLVYVFRHLKSSKNIYYSFKCFYFFINKLILI